MWPRSWTHWPSACNPSGTNGSRRGEHDEALHLDFIDILDQSVAELTLLSAFVELEYRKDSRQQHLVGFEFILDRAIRKIEKVSEKLEWRNANEQEADQ